MYIIRFVRDDLSNAGVIQGCRSIFLFCCSYSAVGTLSPSDCYPVGPAGPYVAEDPVGPDVCFTNPEPVTHTVLVHADPAGQDVSAVVTQSPPDCYPAGPAGPYVAGGPVGPDDYLQVLESCEKLILDHAEPAGQHAVVLDTTESLGDAVVENILDSRPMEGITCPELLEYSLRLLYATMDSGLVKNISDWEPEASPVPDATLTVDLRRGLLTWSIWLRGCPWTVDPWRVCCVWNHRSSRFLIHRWSHNIVNVSWRKDQSGSR